MTSKEDPKKAKNKQIPHYNRPLSERQERFCLLYVLLKNASEAYRQAGYPIKAQHLGSQTAITTISSRMLTNARIKHRIAQLAYRRGLQTKEDLLKFLGFVITSPSDGLPRVSDQVRATEIYGRLEGMFEPERQEIEVSGSFVGYLKELRGSSFGEKRVIEVRDGQAKMLPDVMNERYESNDESRNLLNDNDGASNT